MEARSSCIVTPLLSGFCHCASSLDHFIRSHQHVRRDRQPDLLRRFQTDNELELLRLFDGKIGGLGPF